jgi:hypothetical protein
VYHLIDIYAKLCLRKPNTIILPDSMALARLEAMKWWRRGRGCSNLASSSKVRPGTVTRHRMRGFAAGADVVAVMMLFIFIPPSIGPQNLLHK